jgi:hypothetical protein
MVHVERKDNFEAQGINAPSVYTSESKGITGFDPATVAAKEIAGFESDVHRLETEPAILDLSTATTYAQLQEMEKLVKEEEHKLDKMESLLTEQEALGDDSTNEKPSLRDLIAKSKEDTVEFKKQLEQRKKSFDPQEQIKGTQTEEPSKGNVFLYPSLTTTIFECMLELAKQKILNKDVERELKINMMAVSWQWAQEAAQAALDKGEAKKAQVMTQAWGQLVTGVMHLVSGLGQLYSFSKLKASDDVMRKDPAQADGIAKDPITGKKMVDMETLYRASQYDPRMVVWQTFDKVIPASINATTKFIEAGWITAEAKAEYAQVIANALKEMCDRMYQAAHDAFQGESQQIDAIKQFLDQFAQATTRILKG